MKLRTNSEAVITDYVGGEVFANRTMRVDATPLAREIMAYFQSERTWDGFSNAQDPTSLKTRDALREAGILLERGRDGAPKSACSPSGRTLFDAPHRELADVQRGEFVCLGAPFDNGTTGYPGARFGPDALRAASQERFSCQIDPETGAMKPWNFPAMGGAILGGARLSDLGNVVYHPGEPAQRYYDRLATVTAAIYEAGGHPIVLGGDHSVTYATVPRDPAALVHVDAHCDLADLVEGHAHHHGNVLSRLISEKRVSDVHHFGLRDTSGFDTRTFGTHAASVGDLERDGWARRLTGQPAFVSLDIDVLDPSVAPGTGTPVPGGLTLPQLCHVMAVVARSVRPVGIDLVEVCPMRDASGNTERAAIEALLCFLASWFGALSG